MSERWESATCLVDLGKLITRFGGQARIATSAETNASQKWDVTLEEFESNRAVWMQRLSNNAHKLYVCAGGA